jgi:FkbM family methyltransferase
MPRLPLFRHPVLHFKNKWLHHKSKYTVVPLGTAIKDINGVKFPCDFSIGKRMKSIYSGSYQFEVTHLMTTILKSGDVFIDIGANIGYVSAVGASLVGKTGQVHSFEPVPVYFEYLKKFANLNPGYSIATNNLALGEKTGRCLISASRNIGGSSLVTGMVPEENITGTFDVGVSRLDDYIKEKQLHSVSLIKIDTEGFELPVLLGAKGFFDEHRGKGGLPAIIAEITPRAFELTKTKLAELDNYMSSYGYKTFDVCGVCPVDITKLKKEADILFRIQPA